MKRKPLHLFLVFLATSGTAFLCLCHFSIAYESALIYWVNHIVGSLKSGSALVQSSDQQLFLVSSLQGGPAQFRINGLDWIYASQATAIGVVLSTRTSVYRKAHWLLVTVVTMAIVHVSLLVLFVAALLEHFLGISTDLAAYGNIALELYRVGLPLILSSIWVICSRETLFNAENRVTQRSAASKRTSRVRNRWTSTIFDSLQRMRKRPKLESLKMMTEVKKTPASS